MHSTEQAVTQPSAIARIWSLWLKLAFVRKMEWGGALTGLFGAWMVAANVDTSGYGFVAYLASNIFWVIFGYKQRAWGLVVQQVGFTGSSLLGIYRWLM